MHERLRSALLRSLQARDAVAVAALRSALAAIDDAMAVDVDVAVDGAVDGPPGGAAATAHPTIAGAVAPGAAEVPRRDLSAAQVRAVVEREVAERLATAAEYERLGHPERADRLRSEAGVLVVELDRTHESSASR